MFNKKDDEYWQNEILECFILLEQNTHQSTTDAVTRYKKLYQTVTDETLSDKLALRKLRSDMVQFNKQK